MLDEFDGHGLTAFHSAVIRNNLSICKILEARGDLDKNSVHDQLEIYSGNTSLHIATNNDSIDVLKYLLERGQIDVNTPNLSGHTSLCMAQHSDCAHLLKQYGAIDDHEQNEDEDDNDELSETDENESESLNNDIGIDKITISDGADKNIEKIDMIIGSSVEFSARFEREHGVNRLFSTLNVKNGTDEMKINLMERKERPFDILNLTKLCNILNQNEKWKTVANELGFHDYIESWQHKSDPTKNLIKFAEVMIILFIIYFNE